MRVTVLGGDGMLGHRLLVQLGERHQVRVTLRRKLADYASFGLFDAGNADDCVDVRDFAAVRAAIEAFRPQAVINAVGVVKQRSDANDRRLSVEINALLPHRLAELCATIGARLIHVSTDCVFSGRRGMYSEDDPCDAEDVYGRSKWLGELDSAPAITLRTSIIGRELSRKTGLLEWFLAQQQPIRGYRRAIFSGFTTIELTRIIERMLHVPDAQCGLYQVSSDPISKYDLLNLIALAFGKTIRIEPDDDFVCDRSLDSTRFRRLFGYQPPSWPQMVAEMAARDERG